MAVDDRGADLLGVEISGTGLHQQAAAAEALLDRVNASNVPTGLRELLWEPAHLYPDGVASSVRIERRPGVARLRRLSW